jgi:hypothetical protein
MKWNSFYAIFFLLACLVLALFVGDWLGVKGFGGASMEGMKVGAATVPTNNSARRTNDGHQKKKQHNK